LGENIWSRVVSGELSNQDRVIIYELGMRAVSSTLNVIDYIRKRDMSGELHTQVRVNIHEVGM
jgi:hypothetical protein